MPKPCPVCIHPERQSIERAILASENLREVAKRFALSYWATDRHKRGHIPAGLLKAQQIREVARGDSLLEQVKSLQDKALGLLGKAEATGDLRTALQGVREAKGCLELLAKLQGDLSQEGCFNVVLSPSWVSLRTIILQVLESYPEAKLRIAQALNEVDQC